jgi:tryptophan-rich sensory protein
VVGAEPDHGHIRLAYLACPRGCGREQEPSRGEVLTWWAAAIVIRSGYVPLAFGRRRLWAATADAALLFAVMARYALLARRIDRPAALLAVPEVAWTTFATVLSTTVAAINSQ